MSVLRSLPSPSPRSAGKGVLQSVGDAWVLPPLVIEGPNLPLLLVSDVCHRQLNRLWWFVGYRFAVQGEEAVSAPRKFSTPSWEGQ